MSQSLRGQFLVAARQLNDPNFFKTVVLMIEHGSDGAMGLVVNRPSTISVSNALCHHFDIADDGEMVYVGGPVDPAALFVLHNAEELECCEKAVVPGVFAGSSSEVFEEVVQGIQDQRPGLEFRVFCGCAGWGPGQLEGEIARGDWLTVPASADATFNADPYEVWDLCLANIFRANRILPHTVQNPEWN